MAANDSFTGSTGSGFDNIQGRNDVKGFKDYASDVLANLVDSKYGEMADQLSKLNDKSTPGDLMRQQAYSILFEVFSNVSKQVSDSIGDSQKTLARKG